MAEEVYDGDSNTLFVNGQEVGSVYRHRFFEGEAPVVTFRALNGPVRHVGGQPDYGTATIELYRNHADLGQQELAIAKSTGAVVKCVLEVSDGTRLQFDAICTSMPLIGGKRNGDSINTSNCRLTISGLVTPA